jgi:hypothetical protein
MPLQDLCPCCLKPKCVEEQHDEKFTLYCLEGYFAPKGKGQALA